MKTNENGAASAAVTNEFSIPGLLEGIENLNVKLTKYWEMYGEEYAGSFDVEFDKKNPPKITSSADAIKLLDLLIYADCTLCETVALKALRQAIKRGVV